jgi:NADPH:quinone reductase-like Zn-dependent oxidoreductase
MVSVEYPAILGSPVAGVVKAIGAGVSNVTVGERIVCGTKIFSHKKAKYGGLQHFTVVDESDVVEVSRLCLIRLYVVENHDRLVTSSSPKL